MWSEHRGIQRGGSLGWKRKEEEGINALSPGDGSGGDQGEATERRSSRAEFPRWMPSWEWASGLSAIGSAVQLLDHTHTGTGNGDWTTDGAGEREVRVSDTLWGEMWLGGMIGA